MLTVALKKQSWLPVIFSVLVILAANIPAYSYELVQSEEKMIDLHSGATLELFSFKGDLNIKGWQKEQVKILIRKWVDADNQNQAAAKMENMKIEFTHGKDFLRIQEMKERSGHRLSNVLRKLGLKQDILGKIDLTIYAPHHIKMKIIKDDGHTTLDSLFGDLSLEQKNGSLSLEDISASRIDVRLNQVQMKLQNVKGNSSIMPYITISIKKGNVIIQNSQINKLIADSREADFYLVGNEISSCTVKTKSGDIFLRPQEISMSQYHVETEAGDSYLLIPEFPSCSVLLETGLGIIQSSYPWKIEKKGFGFSFRNRNNHSPAGKIEILTDIGDIYIQKNWRFDTL